jgi:hypothetical protein
VDPPKKDPSKVDPPKDDPTDVGPPSDFPADSTDAEQQEEKKEEEYQYMLLRDEWMTAHNLTMEEFAKDKDLQAFLRSKAHDKAMQHFEKQYEERKKQE